MIAGIKRSKEIIPKEILAKLSIKDIDYDSLSKPTIETELPTLSLTLNNTTPNGVPSIKLGKENYTMEELSYEPLEVKQSKSKYGRQTMAVLARKYAELSGAVIKDTFDASEWSKPLGIIYRHFDKNPDESMEYMKKAVNYYKSKNLSFNIHTLAKSIPDTERLLKETIETKQDVSERRKL